jgi:flavin-dependent dehydrogenase
MRTFDALIVGAGPAGSTTAYRLAASGASVLLVDKARFPRDKPCGGGLTLRAARLLPFSVDPVVEDVVDRFQLRLGYRSSFERVSDGPLCLMTQRRRLDDFLARKAEEAGAEFRHGVPVAFGGGGVIVGAERIRARVIVGADGVNGATARAFGLGRDPVVTRALARATTANESAGYGWFWTLVKMSVSPRPVSSMASSRPSVHTAYTASVLAASPL